MKKLILISLFFSLNCYYSDRSLNKDTINQGCTEYVNDRGCKGNIFEVYQSGKIISHECYRSQVNDPSAIIFYKKTDIECFY